MKKIVVATLSLQKLEATHYKPHGNFTPDYPKDVHFAINAFLANNLDDDDEVKLVLIRTGGAANVADENTKLFIDELKEINESIGATISDPILIDSEFKLENTEYKKIFSQLIKTLEYDAKIYVDCTYGHKAYPFLLTAFLQFAEKFFDCDIENMIYGKVEFDRDRKIVPEKSELYDLSSLYVMNSLSSYMVAPTGEKAIEAIEAFFEG